MRSFIMLLCLLCSSSAIARDGDLDLGFGAQGRYAAAYATDPTYNQANAVVIQGDGKIVVAGTAQTPTKSCATFTAVRLLADAAGVDANFAQNGVAQHCFAADLPTGASDEVNQLTAAAELSDGGVLLVGNASYVLASDIQKFLHVGALTKLTATGGLDTSFGNNGLLIIGDTVKGGGSVAAIAARSDGSFFVVGKNVRGDFALWARSANGGAIDEFDDTAIAANTAEAIALQTDGKIVVAGKYFNATTSNYDCVISRFVFQAGLLTRDVTFGNQGSTELGFDYAGNKQDDCVTLAIQPDGGIVFGGSTDNQYPGKMAVIGRLSGNGNFDPNFNSGHALVTYFASNAPTGSNVVSKILLQADGKILAVGYGTSANVATDVDIGVIRLTAAGTFDTTFGDPHNVGTAMVGFEPIVGGPSSDYGLAGALSQGRVVVAGRADFSVNEDYIVTRLQSDLIFANRFE